MFHNIMLIIFVLFVFFLVRGFVLEQKERAEEKKIEKKRRRDAYQNSINNNSK